MLPFDGVGSLLSGERREGVRRGLGVEFDHLAAERAGEVRCLLEPVRASADLHVIQTRPVRAEDTCHRVNLNGHRSGFSLGGSPRLAAWGLFSEFLCAGVGMKKPDGVRSPRTCSSPASTKPYTTMRHDGYPILRCRRTSATQRPSNSERP